MINTECGVFKTTYKDDLAIHRSPAARHAIYAVLALTLVIMPWLADNYVLGIANLIGVAIIGAVGLNILVGYTGQISLGQGAFMAVGAYTAGVLASRWDVPFWIGIPAAGIVTAAVGSIFAIPALRVKGLYLAIATLAAQFIIEWTLLHGKFITGKGTQSAVIVPDAAFGSFTIDSERSKYYMIFVIAIIMVMAAENLFRTRIGRAFVAIRDRDIAAEVMGVNVFQYKLMAFAISSFYAGVAGGVWAFYINVVGYEQFTIILSIQYLAMIIIGGLGSIPGAILGAMFMTLLPIGIRDTFNALRDIWPTLMFLQTFLTDIIFGLVIILFLIIEPEGIYKMWRNVKDYFRVWPFSY
jgi:branched-chain amino acid transport system permease protein